MTLLYWEEAQHVWQGEHPAAEVVDALAANPIAPFQQMTLNASPDWEPYARNQAIQWLQRGSTPSVGLLAVAPHQLQAAISRYPKHTMIMLDLPNADLTPAMLATLPAFIERVAVQLPKFSQANADAEATPGVFHERQRLPKLPWCFRSFVHWYHLISPLGYAPYYTRADLLGAPAFSIRERGDGWIELISYADPLTYDQPESQRRIIELTRYLDAHRQQRQPS